MVAYTIYKSEKNLWIDTHHKENQEYPSKEELDKYFHPSINTPDTIARYKSQAE